MSLPFAGLSSAARAASQRHRPHLAWAAALILAHGVPGRFEPQAQEGEGLKLQDVTVRPGDTLWGIANTYLKDPTRWNELLRYNKIPGSDPTVALPGMVLKVPVRLIKESLRAASLVYRVNRVLHRKKERADWEATQLGMQLYRDDSLRTLAASRARVRFVDGDVLSLDENSMAILRPRGKDFDLELLKGTIQATISKVVTASARITPKGRNTHYSARVREDLSTRVEVYRGVADVEDNEGGGRVEVKAGFVTDVSMGQAPSIPSRMPAMPQFEAHVSNVGEIVTVSAVAPAPGRAAPGNAALLRGISDGKDFGTPGVGVPIAAYHVQAAESKDFAKILLNRVYDVDETIDLNKAGLAPGRYWWRVATVDLLGVKGRFSPPREYEVRSRR